MVKQKNVCAKQACVIEMDVGNRYFTVRPPRIPWVMTAKALQGSACGARVWIL